MERAKNKPFKAVNCWLFLLNIVAVYMQLIVLAYAVWNQLWVKNVFIVQFFFTSPSLLYHIDPNYRNFCCFRLIARIISTVSWSALILNLVALMISDGDGWEDLALIVCLVCITGPAALSGFTLLLILDNEYKHDREDKQQNEVCYVLVDNQAFENNSNSQLMMV